MKVEVEMSRGFEWVWVLMVLLCMMSCTSTIYVVEVEEERSTAGSSQYTLLDRTCIAGENIGAEEVVDEQVGRTDTSHPVGLPRAIASAIS